MLAYPPLFFLAKLLAFKTQFRKYEEVLLLYKWFNCFWPVSSLVQSREWYLSCKMVLRIKQQMVSET